MSDPVLFVAGLGRCGTTMIMTMLDAGGFPVTGLRPSYEPYERWIGGKADAAWIDKQGGRAVKWLDPTRYPRLIGHLSARPIVILLERHAREQARSQIKMLAGSTRGLGRHAEKAMERSIKQDTPRMRARLGSVAKVHSMLFEDILQNPWWASRSLARLVAEHFNASFDDKAASRVVMDRGPSCLPDMTMETTILPLIAAKLDARGLV